MQLASNIYFIILFALCTWFMVSSLIKSPNYREFKKYSDGFAEFMAFLCSLISLGTFAFIIWSFYMTPQQALDNFNAICSVVSNISLIIGGIFLFLVVFVVVAVVFESIGNQGMKRK